MVHAVSGLTILVELIFNNVSKHVFHLKTCRSNLLRNEAGSCHAWSSVYLYHVYLVNKVALLILLVRDNVVDTYDAVAMQYVIDMAGYLVDTAGGVLAEACRCDFLYLSVVFCVIIEELMLCNYLGSRQHYGLFARLVATYRNLGAIDTFLYHHVLALQHGLAYSWSQLVYVLYFAHTEAAAVGCRLYKARHTDALFYLFIAHELFIALANEQAVCHTNAVRAQLVVQYKLVEGHGFYQHATGRVRQVYQFEVALHDTILARSAVNGDVGIVKLHELAIEYK